MWSSKIVNKSVLIQGVQKMTACCWKRLKHGLGVFWDTLYVGWVSWLAVSAISPRNKNMLQYWAVSSKTWPGMKRYRAIASYCQHSVSYYTTELSSILAIRPGLVSSYSSLSQKLWLQSLCQLSQLVVRNYKDKCNSDETAADDDVCGLDQQ